MAKPQKWPSGEATRNINTWFFELLPPQSPRGCSTLACLYYLVCTTKTAMLCRLVVNWWRQKNCKYLFSNESGQVRGHLIHFRHQIGMETFSVFGKAYHSWCKGLDVYQVNWWDIHSYGGKENKINLSVMKKKECWMTQKHYRPEWIYLKRFFD